MKDTATYSWPMTTAELAKILGVAKTTIRQHQRLHHKKLIYGKGKDYWEQEWGT
jgi:predicted DNA binding protein